MLITRAIWILTICARSKFFMHFLAFFLSSLLLTEAYAKSTILPLPRFVSIKSSEANLRTGPNVRYPVRWVFIKKGEPVEITAEFEQWRKVRDKQGDEGWVHESMLSGQRYVILEGRNDTLHRLYRKPSSTSYPVAQFAAGVRAELKACEQDWCKIEAAEIQGWIHKQELWGVYPHEIFD